MLLDSARQFSGTVNSLDVTNGAVHLEDWANSRPAKLDLTDITLAANKHFEPSRHESDG